MRILSRCTVVALTTAASLYSRIIFHTRHDDEFSLQLLARTESNVLDAAAQGAVNSVFLVLNITANMVAFLAFIAFLNGALSWFGNLLGAPYLTFDVIQLRVII